jgi:carbonic anhydrase/acetyltransferase-like protein (isoleucine patch superfamily)
VLLPYLDFRPELGPEAKLAPHAAVIGRTRAGRGLTLAEYATLRADGEAIHVGDDVCIGARSTVHIADGMRAATIGSRVSVGRYALVHACTLEDEVAVGDAAVIMDGAVVGARAAIAAGALVPPRKQLPGGWLYAGNPAAAVRELNASELAELHAALRAGRAHEAVSDADVPEPSVDRLLIGAVGSDVLHAVGGRSPRLGRSFVAPTAVVAGAVELADDVGIYFGCALAAGDGRIAIGPRSNVQDNSILATSAARGEISIKSNVTVGHNVRMGAALIDDDALIGMGSQLADGVVVEAGACVGARAWVEPGTVVKAGWIWAGRPARAFRAVKPEERQAFAAGCAIYVRYAQAYRQR